MDDSPHLAVHLPTMMLRFAGLLGFIALAASTVACAGSTQTPIRQAQNIEDSDYANYDRPFGVSPGYAGTDGQAVQHATSADDSLRAAPEGATSSSDLGNAALGFSAGGQHVRQDVKETEYVKVEATPGTACYDAAVKAGILTGTCTLISERKYVLVGEKAR